MPKKINEKINDKIANLFESVFKPELKVTYHHPDLRVALAEIDLKESLLRGDHSHIPEDDRDEYLKRLKEGIEIEKAKVAEIKEKVKVHSIDFLITKLKPTEHDRANDALRNATVSAMERLKAGRAVEIENLRQIVDPEGVYSPHMLEMEEGGAAISEARESAIEMITEQILASAGQGEDWAQVPDGDPDLYLTALEEETLGVDDRLSPEDQVAETIDLPERREQRIEEKRDRLKTARQGLRETRKKALIGKGMDALLEILANYQILSKASQEGSIAQDDHELYYSVKDPSEPIEYQTTSGAKVSVNYHRYFSSVEEVVVLRDNYTDLYYFLLEMYRELQQVRSGEDVDRIARSALFR